MVGIRTAILTNSRLEEYEIGIVLNLIGSLTINFGLNLMKYSNKKQEGKVLLNSRSQAYIKTIWYLGTLCFVLGNTLNFFSLSLAAQNLLAPLGLVPVITNIFFSVLLFKESISWGIFVAIAMMVAGITVAVIYSQHDPIRYTTDDLIEAWRGWPYIIYLIVAAVVVVTFFVAYFFIDRKYRQDNITRINKHDRRMHLVAYVSICALIGVNSVVFAKACSELLLTTIAGDSQFTDYFTYVCFILWLLPAMFWLDRLNFGLQFYSSLYYFPISQGVWITAAAVNGGLYFQEFDGFSVRQAFLYSMGVIIALLGVALLAVIQQFKSKNRSIFERQPTMIVVRPDPTPDEPTSSRRRASTLVRRPSSASSGDSSRSGGFVVPLSSGLKMITFEEHANVAVIPRRSTVTEPFMAGARAEPGPLNRSSDPNPIEHTLPFQSGRETATPSPLIEFSPDDKQSSESLREPLDSSQINVSIAVTSDEYKANMAAPKPVKPVALPFVPRLPLGAMTQFVTSSSETPRSSPLPETPRVDHNVWPVPNLSHREQPEPTPRSSPLPQTPRVDFSGSASGSTAPSASGAVKPVLERTGSNTVLPPTPRDTPASNIYVPVPVPVPVFAAAAGVAFDVPQAGPTASLLTATERVALEQASPSSIVSDQSLILTTTGATGSLTSESRRDSQPAAHVTAADNMEEKLLQ
eukprot:GILJ01010190.1.p1 GENE.GILJ01010190.1~~GILJ01010190.1.p1  ORF type:complete len:692 (-),score=109.52 GILJ01010190.1:73-2148(-)